MYFTDYMFSPLYHNLTKTSDNISEGMDPNQFGIDPSADPEAQDGSEVGAEVIEFENIKKYILYGKLKEIKYRVETSDVDFTDPTIINIMEFLDLVILFYNTFSYSDIVKLLDNLVESVSVQLKIKLPSRVDNLNDEPEPELVPMQQPQPTPEQNTVSQNSM